jgi:hypothetical protein
MRKRRTWSDLEARSDLPYDALARWLARLLLEEGSYFEQSDGYIVNLICGYRRCKRNDVYCMTYSEQRRLVCKDLQDRLVPRGCMILWIKMAEEIRHGQIRFKAPSSLAVARPMATVARPE